MWDAFNARTDITLQVDEPMRHEEHTVTFKRRAHLKDSEHLYIVGDCKAMGDSDMSCAIKMKFDESSHQWVTKVVHTHIM